MRLGIGKPRSEEIRHPHARARRHRGHPPAGRPVRSRPVGRRRHHDVREEDVLLTVARGRTNAEIADELHISMSTVKTHLASLIGKLAVRNRVELAMWAYETGRMKG